jgi:hypothetical protein
MFTIGCAQKKYTSIQKNAGAVGPARFFVYFRYE